MKILFAADCSKFTKKALAFLVNHENLCGPADELVVLHVQQTVSRRVQSMLGVDVVRTYQEEEALKVLNPIERFLKRHKLPFRVSWMAGSPAVEIVRTAHREKAQLIVMGTQGHGLLGRVLMGSVAQKVLTASETPVLLVK